MAPLRRHGRTQAAMADGATVDVGGRLVWARLVVVRRVLVTAVSHKVVSVICVIRISVVGAVRVVSALRSHGTRERQRGRHTLQGQRQGHQADQQCAN
jgi:hypothetical protein